MKHRPQHLRGLMASYISYMHMVLSYRNKHASHRLQDYNRSLFNTQSKQGQRSIKRNSCAKESSLRSQSGMTSIPLEAAALCRSTSSPRPHLLDTLIRSNPGNEFGLRMSLIKCGGSTLVATRARVEITESVSTSHAMKWCRRRVSSGGPVHLAFERRV